MHVAAIIAAGGRGQRLGAGRPKQFLDDWRGVDPRLERRALAASDRIDEIVVALPHEYVAATSQSWEGKSDKPLMFVAGGERRQDSVASAFARTSPDADLIVIHDAARPFVTGDVIARTIDAAAVHGAAIAAIPVPDTVKQVGEAPVGGSRRIRATIARDTIVLAQTPQAFRRDVLARALAEGLKLDATDEAMLAERLGLPVHIVDGDVTNIKVTMPEDLTEARRACGGRGLEPAPDPHRHRVRPASPRRRPAAHSGRRAHSLRSRPRRPLRRRHRVPRRHRRGAGRRGRRRHRPDVSRHRSAMEGRRQHRAARGRGGADRRAGLSRLERRRDRDRAKPKLLPHLDAMRANLAAALQVGRRAVSIKGKTNEGVDSTGRGEAMACHAVALLATA